MCGRCLTEICPSFSLEASPTSFVMSSSVWTNDTHLDRLYDVRLLCVNKLSSLISFIINGIILYWQTLERHRVRLARILMKRIIYLAEYKQIHLQQRGIKLTDNYFQLLVIYGVNLSIKYN